MRTETILAIDPGLRDLGYAVLRGQNILIANVLPLRPHPTESRLRIAKEAVRGWLRTFAPSVIVWETASKHAIGGHAEVHRLMRWVGRFARSIGADAATYSAKAVRRNVAGNGWASKLEVAEAITARFPQLRVHRGFDRKWKEAYWHNLFDAVALALHHQSAHKQPPSRSRSSG